MMRQPAIVAWLGGLIFAVYLLEVFMPRDMLEALFQNFGVVPSRFAPGANGFANPIEMLGPIFGHAFLHDAPWPLHVGMNLLVYFQVAGMLAMRLAERGGGTWRYLVFFFGSAAAAATAYILINPNSDIPAVGASGAICGLFAGYLLGARANWRKALADPQIRRAGFWFLFINVGLAALAQMSGVLPIAWEAHLGGFIGGAVLFPLLAPRRPSFAGPWG